MTRDVRMRGFRDRRPVAEALAMLDARTAALETERVSIAHAVGRVVATEVLARVAVPHFARSAMDGYAITAASVARATPHAPVDLRLVGEVRAGGAEPPPLREGEAVRITTGAPVPPGADCVLMAEKAEEIASSAPRATSATLATSAPSAAPPTTPAALGLVRVREPIPAGKHVGSIGEDVPAGSVIVRAGRRLRPQDAGVLASAGVVEIAAVRRPTVRVIITGDELLAPGEVPHGSRIVDTNSLVLTALAARDGAALTTVQRVRDDRAATRDALLAATEDILLVSGGSSVGPEDHAPLVLAEIGEVLVHGVALRPASPTGFGFLRRPARNVPVFLLPGNPVSCLCAYEIFAGPTVRALGGRPREWPHHRRDCTAARPIPSERGRTDYTRVQVQDDTVTALMTSGASILSSTTRADGVILIPHDSPGVAEGERVTVFLYDD